MLKDVIALPSFLCDFSFFSNRRRHYKQLNVTVLRPLTHLQLEKLQGQSDSIIDNFRYEIINLQAQFSKICNLASKHMDFVYIYSQLQH